ncbi:hypothetical protein M407DRAFT_34109 [Tulasnella calospora MUT 4182]|uniref:Uncharacterized protein n=1 Tax=Tulasnella calospora MUT 4182 TaxID=1051891 RepID=A0A0C3Q153_9AGAM|nr:hypothetical protein M407DRAFT_34109 [Tulasnella calospora MUT 4182]
MQRASRRQDRAIDDTEAADEDGVHRYTCFSGTIEEFCNQSRMYGETHDQLTGAFFGISGFSPDRKSRLVVTIPEDNVVPEDVEKQFDIDSVKGGIFEGDPWPFLGQCQFYPISPPTESVSEGSRYFIEVNGRKLPIHRMINMGFGIANDKIRLRVVFPGTFDSTSRHTVSFPTEKMKEAFYDLVLLPAVLELHPNSEAHWPLSYRHRKWAARCSNGRLKYPMKLIPQAQVPHLVPTMHRIIRSSVQQPEYTELLRPMVGFVIAWEIQDIKLSTAFEPDLAAPPDHNFSYTRSLQDAINIAFSDTDTEALVQENTYVDLAVEMSAPNQSLYFRDGGHALILQHILGYSQGVAEHSVSSTSRGARYQKDRMVGLSDIAGFHFNLKGDACPSGYLYAQAYHTEKEIGYQASSKNKIVPLEAIEMLRPQTQERRQYHNYTESAMSALVTQVQRGVRNRARFEVTTPLSRLGEANINFSHVLLQTCLVALDPDTIPFFRYVKLRACADVAVEVCQYDVATRTTPEVVGLMACLYWIIMSMFGRPSQTDAGEWISASGHLGPEVQDDSLFTHGQYLLTNVNITESECPRLRVAADPPTVVLKEIYDVDSLPQLQARLDTSRRANPAIARGRLPTHSTARSGHEFIPPLDAVQARVNDRLEQQGVVLRRGAGRDGGDDIDIEQPRQERRSRPAVAPEGLMAGWPIDCWIEGIFHMYMKTWWQKVPNERGRGSWLATPAMVVAAYDEFGPDEWRLPLEEIERKFRKVEIIHNERSRNRSFRHCFPETEDAGGQNLSRQPCREEWRRIMRSLRPQDRSYVVRLMRAKFDTLTAVPDVRHDKWWTSSASRGPVLLVNPARGECGRRSGYKTLAELVEL